MVKEIEEYKRRIKQQQRETRTLRTVKKRIPVQKRIEKQEKFKRVTSQGRVADRLLSKAERTFERSIGSRKESKYRARAVQGILGATGISGKQTYKGAGRPRGTYKYGMPIQVYKAQLRQKKALYQQYQQEQAMKLRSRGFTPEQLQQLQQQQTYSELEQPTQRQVQQQVQRIQQVQQQVQRIQQVQQQQGQTQTGQYQKMKVPTNTKYIQPGPSVADEELNFRKWSAEQTISPNTQRILDTIRRIQNKGKSDNIEQQRRIRERTMVMKSMNLMKAHENMIDTSMDFTKVDMNENILGAPNVFKQNGSQLNILRTDRPNILQTKLTGNSLFF